MSYEPTENGRYYFNVRTTNGLSIYLYADRVEINSTGDLLFWREGEITKINIAFASGEWRYFYPAGEFNGACCSILRCIKEDEDSIVTKPEDDGKVPF